MAEAGNYFYINDSVNVKNKLYSDISKTYISKPIFIFLDNWTLKKKYL